MFAHPVQSYYKKYTGEGNHPEKASLRGSLPQARSQWLCIGILWLLLTAPRVAFGQGCMSLRFTSPSLGGLNAPYLLENDWQFEIALRRVTTDKFFVGSQEDESAAPFGQPPLDLSLNSLDLSITYATTERECGLFLSGSPRNCGRPPRP